MSLSATHPGTGAIGAPAPHQCCIRKSRISSTRTQVEGERSSENCCPPRTPSLWAAPVAPTSLKCGVFVIPNRTCAQSQSPVVTHVAYKSVRAPPLFSIA